MSELKIRTRTKIIATIGPASGQYDTICDMIEAGMDVARMNFSHGHHDAHLNTVDHVRKYNEQFKSNVCLLGDLQGPKLRVGEVANEEIILESEKKILLSSEDFVSTPQKLSIHYRQLSKDIRAGERILLDDGKITLKVLSSGQNNLVEALIIHGGKLTANKGVNFPDSILSVTALLEKDQSDLLFALKHEVEWIALSFVRSADDINQLKKIIASHKSKALVIAKIEKPEAVKNISEIIEVADGIMVARGDLGVEMAMEEVPILQKSIVAKCIEAAKPVIIATQMMESMIENPTPTRAETNDVTNAVLDGADAVMLSAETSVGSYPVIVVKTMEKIVRFAETQKTVYHKRKSVNEASATFLTDEICHQACRMSESLNAKAIVSMTHSGYTAYQLASFRPQTPIYIFTDNKLLLNTVNLIWGVKAFYYNKFATTDESIGDVNNILKQEGYVKTGDLVINTASMPLHERNRTNTIRVTVMG